MALENGATLEMVENIIDGTTPVAKASNADSAEMLTSNAGSSSNPVYFSGGKPVQCSSTLNANISGSAASAGYASSAGSATNATNATNDGQGRNIADTYATKAEASGGTYRLYVHNLAMIASGMAYATILSADPTPMDVQAIDSYAKSYGPLQVSGHAGGGDFAIELQYSGYSSAKAVIVFYDAENNDVYTAPISSVTDTVVTITLS